MPFPKNGGVIYWINIKLPSRKDHRERLGMVSRANAQKRHDEVVMSIREGRYQNKEDLGERTWKDLRRAFERKLESEGAGKIYKAASWRALVRMGEFWGDERPIAEVTPSMIKDFRLTLLDKGRKKATCDRYLAAGKAAWNHFEDTLPNPFSKVRFFNPANQVTRYLTPKERAALLTAARAVSQTMYEIVVVAMGTGLRKNNVVRLRRSEVDWERKEITVTIKGGRTHTVMMLEEVQEILSNIPHNGTEHYWISPRTGRPYHQDWNKSWHKAKRLAGIPRSFRFHDLRHDVGTAIYAATHDLQLAQKLLGHTQLSTTQRYAHVLPDYMRDSMEGALLNRDCRTNSRSTTKNTNDNE